MYFRVLSLLSFLLLVSCSNEPQLNATQTLTQLQSLNSKLVGDFTNEQAPWPYTEEYLKQRHQIYANVNAQTLSDAQLRTYDYLRTEERFVRRYQPWPLLLDVAEHSEQLQTPKLQSELAKWLTYVEAKLQQGERSKIYINQVEREHMQAQLDALISISSTDSLSKAIRQLQDYLAQYIPRNQLGLSQLPNGKDWFQVKINYYSDQVHSPIQWMTAVQKQLNQANERSLEPLPKQALSVLGDDLDWRQNYRDIKSWAKSQQLSSAQAQLALIWMELDLGVHYQMWDKEFVMTALAQRGVTPQVAEGLFKQVLRHPGQSFMFASIVHEL
ncbi:hypothetical protein V1358_04795 [Pseudoalteromonas sp. YIC-656]|uniref:hypothetical protein n=1 Tax=Pseudoalteromonas pernae TaxID=3118054 RepID=UPI003242B1AF